MALSKPGVAEQTLTLAKLNPLLAELAAADTTSRLVRNLAKLLHLTTSLPVSTFAYGPTGFCDHLDEQTLPTALRDTVSYPELIGGDHRPTMGPAAWSRQPQIQQLAAQLNAKQPGLYWLEYRGEALGGAVIWGAPAKAAADLVELILREAAGTLQRLKMHQEVNNNLAESMALQRITQAITRSLDFDQVASTLLKHAHKLFQVDAVALALSNPKDHEFYVDQAIGLSEEYMRALRVPHDSDIARQLIKNASPTEYYDVSNAPISNRPELTRREGIKSLLLTPIFSGGKPVGALGLISKRPRHFVYSELRFAQSLAEQAGIAFANANLHANLQKVSNEIEQTRNLMRDGLLVFDLQHRLRYFNAAAGSLLKLNSKTLMHPLSLAPLVDQGELKIDLAQLHTAIVNASQGQAGNTNFSLEGGKPGHYEAIYSPYRDTKGDPVGVLMNIRNVTSLYREKEKLRTIQDNISDGLIMVDAKGATIEYNQEWQRLFDIKEDLTGKPFFAMMGARKDFVCDQDPAELIKEVLQGRRLICYGRSQTKAQHIQISLSPITAAGCVTGAVATARDITPLIEKTVEANEMAAKAQRHLRELSQLAELSGIVGFNVANIYQKYLSKTAALLNSTSVSIYLYNPVEQHLVRRETLNPSKADTETVSLDTDHPVTQAFMTRRATNTQSHNPAHLLAIPITHHSKTLGVLLVGRSDRPFSEHDAKLARLVATRLAVLVENANLYHDVNARRERWEAVFRFTEEGIVIFDRSGTIVGFNPASTEITQYNAAEAIGQPFARIIKTIGPEGAGAGLAPLERVLGEGITIAKSEQLIESRTGSRIWTEVSYSPIFDDTGRVTSGIAIIRNTSKDREVEEIKSDFISIVSHELRTPLTAIKGFLSMTLKGDFGALAGKQYHYLSRVYQSNQRMIDLVEDLMDATYIESGKINLAISPVAMESVISEVVSELAAKGAANQIMINVRRRQRLPLVLADETRLHQIVLNLVDNAIKYSMPGTEVEIDFKIQGDELITTVADHGVGISKNQIDRLFTKFGRIFNPLSVQAGGTGLGLYIVKNLVESHNGRIWVTSQEGKGSKFHFSLPIAKQLPLLA
ncbi:MAG: multi-sensor signal transduction histidine kinase [Patescibacteria group bacterium]|nr:multi-sensor signal transduction histidine kinase [Patescibacteria group bacterium]